MTFYNSIADNFIKIIINAVICLDKLFKRGYDKISTKLFYRKLSIISWYNKKFNRKYKLVIDGIDPYMNSRHFDYVDTLPYANFQMLANFVERGRIDVIDWNHTKHHKKAHAEMISLYNWWKKYKDFKAKVDNGYFYSHLNKSQFPNFKDYFKRNEDGTFSFNTRRNKYKKYYSTHDIVSALSDNYEQEINENLHRLINIRRFLWT